MKKIFLILCLLAVTFYSDAQIKGILDRAKQKTANKASEKVDKTIDKTTDPSSGKTEKPATEAEKKATENNDAAGTAKPATDTVKKEPASIKAYSKYDFVPGEKIIGFEDFSTGTIGDFPAGWNTNGSAEIVTIEGKPGRWLWITKPVCLFLNLLIDFRMILRLNLILFTWYTDQGRPLSILVLPNCRT